MKLVKRAMSMLCALCIVMSVSALAFAATPEIVPARAEVHCQVGGRIGVLIEKHGTEEVGYDYRNCQCDPVVGGTDTRIQYQDWMWLECTACEYKYKVTYTPRWGEWYHVW